MTASADLRLDRSARRVYKRARSAVHARVSTYQGDVDRLIDGFRRQANLVRRLDGFARAYLLVDRAGGRAMTVTLWDSEEAREASAERAAHLREEATETAGATIGSVDGYELALEIERAG